MLSSFILNELLLQCLQLLSFKIVYQQLSMIMDTLKDRPRITNQMDKVCTSYLLKTVEFKTEHPIFFKNSVVNIGFVVQNERDES